MGTPPELAIAAIVRCLDTSPGPALYVGPLALARSLGERRPLWVVDERVKPARLARDAVGLTVLRCAARLPPLADGCLSALIVVDRVRGLPEIAPGIARWSELLRPGGQLLVLERLGRGRALRTLGRALGRRARPAPEDLTACLLGAGFGRIGQRFFSAGFVLTRGRRLAPSPT